MPRCFVVLCIVLVMKEGVLVCAKWCCWLDLHKISFRMSIMVVLVLCICGLQVFCCWDMCTLCGQFVGICNIGWGGPSMLFCGR